MNTVSLIFSTLLGFLMAWILFRVGRVMVQMDSVRDAIAGYEKNSKTATWVEHYFFGWAFSSQRYLMKAIPSGRLNGLLTLWFKVTGALFILLGVAAAASPLVLWYLSLTA